VAVIFETRTSERRDKSGFEMQLSFSQQMKMSQQMKLAPRMIQSMEILQLPIMALQGAHRPGAHRKSNAGNGPKGEAETGLKPRTRTGWRRVADTPLPEASRKTGRAEGTGRRFGSTTTRRTSNA